MYAIQPVNAVFAAAAAAAAWWWWRFTRKNIFCFDFRAPPKLCKWRNKYMTWGDFYYFVWCVVRVCMNRTPPQLLTHITRVIIIIYIYIRSVRFVCRKINHASFARCLPGCSYGGCLLCICPEPIDSLLLAGWLLLHHRYACFRNDSLRDFVRLTVECINQEQRRSKIVQWKFMFEMPVCATDACERFDNFFFVFIFIFPIIYQMQKYPHLMEKPTHFSDIKFHPNICKW